MSIPKTLSRTGSVVKRTLAICLVLLPLMTIATPASAAEEIDRQRTFRQLVMRSSGVFWEEFSENGEYRFGFEENGILSLSTTGTHSNPNRIIWSIGAAARPGWYAKLFIAPSGNVVFEGAPPTGSTNKRVLWESDTKGEARPGRDNNIFMELRNDGELRIRTYTRIIKVLSPPNALPEQPYTCGGKAATMVTDDRSIRGSNGEDVIVVLNQRGAGEKVVGLGGNDTICGNDYANDIFGSGGDDTLRGYGGNDLLKGERGNDTLVGHKGNDKLVGNWGNDKLFGSEGADRLFGSQDNDYLNGEAGDDYLNGEGGYDTSGDRSGSNTYVSIENR